jgi:conjugal transfer pilus assembly protein TraV
MITKRLLISVFIGSTFGILSGCTSLNSHFDCPMKPGVVCKSLDEVNTMVDQGKLGGSASYSKPLSTSVSSGLAPLSSDALLKFSHDDRPTKATRIWIAPYQDKSGNYYPSTLVYREVKPNWWGKSSTKVLNDIKEGSDAS